jgi:outer membrane protein OmpA-like peptidoglycan-associated protein
VSDTAQSVGDERRSLDARSVDLILLALLLCALAVLSVRVEDRAPPGGAWLAKVQENLAGRGYDWLKIDIADGVATVSGEAPDVDSRQFGFEAAEAAIQRSDTGKSVRLVVDATTMEGAAPSSGAALNGLGAAPTAETCNGAFAATLTARPLSFERGSAELSAEDKPVLDALSAVAIRCKAYRIEIGGHADRAGAAAANLTLSQQRAEAVQRYLTERGVPATQLTTRGYGSSKLLDPGRSPAANARNRRIEFTVSAS